jgi:SHS2 domain-containing protein
MGATGHRTVPHTADVTLQAWAPTREQCLVEVVTALVDSVLDTFGTASVRRHSFHLTAASEPAAVAMLLDEVIYLLDARGEVPLSTHLQPADSGVVHGWFELADAGAAELVGSIPKGVALSGLVMDRDEHGWRCAVTVDV